METVLASSQNEQLIQFIQTLPTAQISREEIWQNSLLLLSQNSVAETHKQDQFTSVGDEFFFRLLLESPQLFFYQSQIDKILSAEKQKRADFYEWVTEDSRAEFINGEIVVHSPAKHRHTLTSVKLLTLLNAYVLRHDLGVVLAETAMISLTRNDYLPDICFFSQEKKAKISEEQMTYPAPDLIVEILSPSTEKIDRGVKFKDYAAHGVQEYWLVDPEKRFVEQYLLSEDGYQLRTKARLGDRLQSQVVVEFQVEVDALFVDSANLLALQTIIVGES